MYRQVVQVIVRLLEQDVFDLNYITLKISNLIDNTDGSNNNIRKSSAVLVLDRSLDTSNSTGKYVKNEGDTDYIEIGNKAQFNTCKYGYK